MKIRLEKKDVGKVALAATFLFLMLYANFYAVRRMEYYAVRAYFYQRLAVAYDIGKTPAVRQQLSKIFSEKNNPRQKEFAKITEDRLGDIIDPGAYLNDKLEQNKAGFERLRQFREIVFALLMVLVFMQILFRRKPH